MYRIEEYAFPYFVGIDFGVWNSGVRISGVVATVNKPERSKPNRDGDVYAKRDGRAHTPYAQVRQKLRQHSLAGYEAERFTIKAFCHFEQPLT